MKVCFESSYIVVIKHYLRNLCFVLCQLSLSLRTILSIQTIIMTNGRTDGDRDTNGISYRHYRI